MLAQPSLALILAFALFTAPVPESGAEVGDDGRRMTAPMGSFRGDPALQRSSRGASAPIIGDLVVTGPIILSGKIVVNSLYVAPGGVIQGRGDLAIISLGGVTIDGEIIGSRGTPRGGAVVIHSHGIMRISGTVQGGHGDTHSADGGCVILRAPKTLLSGLVIGGDGMPGLYRVDGPGGDGGHGGHAICFGPSLDPSEHLTGLYCGGAAGRAADGGALPSGHGARGGDGGNAGSAGVVEDVEEFRSWRFVQECLRLEEQVQGLPWLAVARASSLATVGRHTLLATRPSGALAWLLDDPCAGNKGGDGVPDGAAAPAPDMGGDGTHGGGSGNPQAANCAAGNDGNPGNQATGGMASDGGNGGAPTASPGSGGDGGDGGLGGNAIAGGGGDGQGGGHCCVPEPAHGGDGGDGMDAGSANGSDGGCGGDGAFPVPIGQGEPCKGGAAGKGGNGGSATAKKGGTGGNGGNGLVPGIGGDEGDTKIATPGTGGDKGTPGAPNSPQQGARNLNGDPGQATQSTNGSLSSDGGGC